MKLKKIQTKKRNLNQQISFYKAVKYGFNNLDYMSEGKILPSFPFGIVINVAFGEEIYLKLSE